MKTGDRSKKQLLADIENLQNRIAELESSSGENFPQSKEGLRDADDSGEQAIFQQLLLDSTIDGYVIADSEENIIGANQAYCELMGYSRDELLKMKIGQLKPQDPPEIVRKRTQELLSKGRDRFETQHLHKNGKLLELEATVSVFRYKEQTMMVGFMRDISERKRVFEALKESEYMLRESQKVANLGSYNLDFSSGIWTSSIILDEIFGIDEKFKRDVPNWLSIIHSDEREGTGKYFETLVAEKQQLFDREYRILRHNDQKERWVHGLGELEYAADRTPVKMIGTIQDITERKHAEEVLLKMNIAINNSSDVVFLTDPDGIITYVNPEFTRLYGFSEEEVVGKVTPRILKSGFADLKVIQYMWSTLLNKQSIPTSQYVNKRKDGSLIDVEASADPVLDENGNLIGFLGIQRDITERKRAETIQKVLFHISNAANTSDNLNNLLSFIQNELGKVIDTTHFIVVLYDERTGILSFPLESDERGEEKTLMAELTLSKYIIEDQESLLLERDEIWEKTKAGGIEVYDSEVEQWLGVPLKFKGKVTGVLVLQSYDNPAAFDESDVQMLEFVSDQISLSIYYKKAEENLREALEKATESDRLKSAFLASMSHELRTPLNAVIGFSDIFSRDLSAEEMMSYASIINSSGNQLLSIVEDLFDITLIEAGEIKIRQRREELYPIMEYIKEIFEVEKQNADKKDLEFKLLVAPKDKNVVIYTDTVKLKQILINILKNALKFTTEGHVHFGYHLENIDGKDFIKFRVEDTGKGIPEHMHELIFDVFRQLDSSHTHSPGGTGIGLSIAKKTTELLGGKIWLESKEGKGSIFYFTIPANSSAEDIGINPNTKTGSPAKAQKSRQTILIVEDDEASFTFLKILLRSLKVNILWAKTGLEAIASCKKNPQIALILMDINLPELDGYEATQEIKKLRPELPIIAQTANAVHGDTEKALEAGCDDYISKPIKKDVLWVKLEKHLGISGFTSTAG